MKKTHFILIGLISLAGALAGHAQSSQVDSWTVWPTAAYVTVDATIGTGYLTTSNSATFSYSADYIYTGSNAPEHTLTLNTLAGVDTITLQINLAGEFSSGPSLIIDSIDYSPASFQTSSGTSILGFEGVIYTYTWDVSEFSFDSTFEIGWALTTHDAFNSITVTQSAIPEPSSFAALAGIATLGAAALRRRRRA